MKVWACQSKDGDLLKQSSSGGVFSLLAREIFSQGGVVFGAVYENGRCFHKSARNEAELSALRGSKYLKSDLGSIFSEIKALLGQNIDVLFCGTPCQAKSLANKAREFENSEKLYLVDLICHGVPEQKVWEAYIARFPSAPVTAIFRDKANGWRDYSLKFTFANGEVEHKGHRKDPFMKAYLNNICLREACHKCTANYKEKLADITLGDDWGGVLENGGDKGSSVVLAHTNKGEELFTKIAEQCRCVEADYERVKLANPSLVSAAKPHPKRAEFSESVNAENFDELVNKFCKESLKPRLRRAAGKILGLIKRL